MGWYEAAKDAIFIAKKADNIELMGQLLDLQKAMQDMQQENYELKTEIANLKMKIEKAKNMEYDCKELVFYNHTEDGIKEGPYCPACWQKDKNAVYLQPFSLDLMCSVCGNVVGDKNAHQEERNALQMSF